MNGHFAISSIYCQGFEVRPTNPHRLTSSPAGEAGLEALAGSRGTSLYYMAKILRRISLRPTVILISTPVKFFSASETGVVGKGAWDAPYEGSPYHRP